MNQFRDILMCVLIILALGMAYGGDPDSWGWPSLLGNYVGGYVVNGIHWLAETRPWSVVLLLALALALFMTRIKY